MDGNAELRPTLVSQHTYAQTLNQNLSIAHQENNIEPGFWP